MDIRWHTRCRRCVTNCSSFIYTLINLSDAFCLQQFEFDERERERERRERVPTVTLHKPPSPVSLVSLRTHPPRGFSEIENLLGLFFFLFLPDHPQSDISVIPRGLTICSHALSSHVTMLVLSLASSRGKWDSVESLSRHLGVLFGWFVPFRGDLREYKLR